MSSAGALSRWEAGQRLVDLRAGAGPHAAGIVALSGNALGELAEHMTPAERQDVRAVMGAVIQPLALRSASLPRLTVRLRGFVATT